MKDSQVLWRGAGARGTRSVFCSALQFGQWCKMLVREVEVMQELEESRFGTDGPLRRKHRAIFVVRLILQGDCKI